VDYDGHVAVSVTLSAENLARGVAATRAEVERFVAEGVPAEALARTRTTLAGQHVVALATTGGVAARLLVNAERGFDVGYLDRYPDLVRALTDDDVAEALRRHLRPDAFHEAVAGTPPDGA
jgi:predicted Zn-dependent peptidase